MTARVAVLASDDLPAGWVWADRKDWTERYAIPSAFAPFREAAERCLS